MRPPHTNPGPGPPSMQVGVQRSPRDIYPTRPSGSRQGHRGAAPSRTRPEEVTAVDEPLIPRVAMPGLQVIAAAPHSGHCGTPPPGGLRDPAQSATRPSPGWPRTRCTPLALLKGPEMRLSLPRTRPGSLIPLITSLTHSRAQPPPGPAGQDKPLGGCRSGLGFQGRSRPRPRASQGPAGASGSPGARFPVPCPPLRATGHQDFTRSVPDDGPSSESALRGSEKLGPSADHGVTRALAPLGPRREAAAF